jgi:hypothetical protein
MDKTAKGCSKGKAGKNINGKGKDKDIKDKDIKRKAGKNINGKGKRQRGDARRRSAARMRRGGERWALGSDSEEVVGSDSEEEGALGSAEVVGSDSDEEVHVGGEDAPWRRRTDAPWRHGNNKRPSAGHS